VIRTLHVITRLTLGGSSENTVGQIVALGRAGYDCALAVGVAESETATVDDARRRGCRVLDVPGLGREVAPTRDVAALLRLVRLCRRERPAIVHTHTSKAGFVGRLAARIARVPVVIHQPHGHIFYGYYDTRRTTAYVALERLAARWSDRIVTLTDLGRDEHLAQRIGRREQFVTIPSGVPVRDLQARAPGKVKARTQLGVSPSAFVILGLGRLVPVKGFDLLVEALARVKPKIDEVSVVIVGDGPERDRLAARAAELGVADRLVLAGAVVAPEALALHFAAADVFAAPARNEGMGRALVEAMALGLPVVGTAVGGIPSVIGDDVAGRVVAPEDVDGLADALLDLASDSRLRSKLAEAARRRAHDFSTDVADMRLLSLYAELVEAKGLR
jgi:glycosyltransferase involved in cell wall biosynthesis